MADIVVKVPPTVDERVAGLIAEAIFRRLRSLAYVNEILMNSELTEEDAIELERKAKKGRGRYLERKYSLE